MKVYVINTKTNEVVYQNDEVFSVRRTIYKNDEKTKYFEIEERRNKSL